MQFLYLADRPKYHRSDQSSILSDLLKMRAISRGRGEISARLLQSRHRSLIKQGVQRLARWLLMGKATLQQKDKS